MTIRPGDRFAACSLYIVMRRKNLRSPLSFAGLCLAVALERGFELRRSRRHERRLRAAGGQVAREPAFPLMVAVHAGMLVLGPLEAWRTGRRLPRAVSGLALAAVAAATGLRLWALGALGDAWSVHVVRFPGGRRPVVGRGPYRFIRHPNYLAVIVELAALPLVGGAVGTALVASALDAVILAWRIPLEERELFEDPLYRAVMAHRPRFLPRLGH